MYVGACTQLADKKPRRRRVLKEQQSSFRPATVTPNDVFAAWEFRCAFTGADLTEEAKADPFGALLRLVIPDDPSLLPPGSAIPACLDAIWAYEQGHLSIGSRGEFVVALDVISPEFLEALNPIGRLTPPRDEQHQPDRRILDAHLRDMLRPPS